MLQASGLESEDWWVKPEGALSEVEARWGEAQRLHRAAWQEVLQGDGEEGAEAGGGGAGGWAPEPSPLAGLDEALGQQRADEEAVVVADIDRIQVRRRGVQCGAVRVWRRAVHGGADVRVRGGGGVAVGRRERERVGAVV